jgi:superfamily II DNA or RNA helicase
VVDGNNTKTNSYVIENLPDKYVIFTTYSQFSTGIDVPSLNSMFIALPTKSKFEQTLGRILRTTCEDKYVVDVDDKHYICEFHLSE